MVAPETEKPLPVTVAALTVTAAVPVDVKVTDCEAGEFSTTLPKDTLLAFTLSVGTDAFNCSAKLFETLLADPGRVTVSVALALYLLAGQLMVAAVAGKGAQGSTDHAPF